MSGIAKAKYGYKGTQGTYGGVPGYGGMTGMSGALAPGDVTIRQGLIPLGRRSRR